MIVQQLHCLHSIAALFISHLSVPILYGFHLWHIMLGMQTAGIEMSRPGKNAYLFFNQMPSKE